MRSSVVFATLCLLGFAELAVAQQSTLSSSLLPGAGAAAVTNDTPSCNRVRLQSDTTLTLKQWFCLKGEPLTTPQFALQAGMMAAFGQLRNSERIKNQGFGEFPRRFGSYYARHSAQAMGEALAGYLHHEDPRWHPSSRQSFMGRSQAAMLSVVIAKQDNGSASFVFAPLAGSLSSGAVSMLTSTRDRNLEGGLRRAGFVYSTYFVKAIFQEFRPELTSYTRRLLHRN